MNMMHYILFLPILPISYRCRFMCRFILIMLKFVASFAIILTVWNKFSNATNPKDERASFTLDDSSKHLWWMVQISDLHLNMFSPTSLQQFHSFVNHVLPVIKPHTVVATGDLTNAINEGHYPRTGQKLSEWRYYRKVILQYYALTKRMGTRTPVWMDTRGNHDSFDVPSIGHYQNLYNSFSMSNFSIPERKEEKVEVRNRHKVYKFKHDDVAYSIVTVDAAPSPGLRGPFNFFGHLSAHDLENLRKTDEELKNSTVSIWAGHYPTSTIVSGGSRQILGEVIRNGAVYLCGHFHKLSILDTGYVRHNSGQMELILSDFKSNMKFRILVVDHGKISFVDSQANHWPLVVVTNPKPSSFLMPSYENTNSVIDSTHIRVLAFSPDGIAKVTVFLNGKIIGEATQNEKEKSLFTLSWQPKELPKNTWHLLTVVVVDRKGSINADSRVSFFIKSLDDWMLGRGLLPPQPSDTIAQFIMLSSLSNTYEGIFYSFTLILVFLSCFFRCAVTSYHSLQLNPNVTLLISLGIIVYPMFGPWFTGLVMSTAYGTVFAIGVFLDNWQFVPEPSIALSAIKHQLFFTFPIMSYFYLLIVLSVNKKASNLFEKSRRYQSLAITRAMVVLKFFKNWLPRLFFILIILYQFYKAYIYALSYCWLALVTNVLNVWIPILLIFCDVILRQRLNKLKFSFSNTDKRKVLEC